MARLGTHYGSVAHELAALDSDIGHAARSESFYHYPREKAQMVINAAAEWKQAITAFPSIEKDVVAAIDCCALGHSNASTTQIYAHFAQDHVRMALDKHAQNVLSVVGRPTGFISHEVMD